MKELIESLPLEDRIVEFSTNDGDYLLEVFDRRTGNSIPKQSIRLSRDDITNNLTHIPNQQISALRRYGPGGIAALVFLGGAYAASVAGEQGGGQAIMGSLFISTLVALGILYQYTRTFNPQEYEFNQTLSKYKFSTLKHSK